MVQNNLGSASLMFSTRITLFLVIFLLALLVSIPFVLNAPGAEGLYFYVVYSLILTSVGVLLGTTLMVLRVQRSGILDGVHEAMVVSPPLVQNVELTSTTVSESSIDARNWNEDERWVLLYLKENGGYCFQSALSKDSTFSNPKVSRLVAKLCQKNAVSKTRDGMGNRLVLNEEVIL